MNYLIRELNEKESPILDDFLYEAIFIPEGVAPPPKSIIAEEALQIYVRDFGKFPDDKCFVAETDGNIIGAVWVRIMNDYGHVDDETPSLAISLYKEYRHQGIGTALMKTILNWLKISGYQRVSLSVQKENYAVRMYQHVGFEIISDNGEELIMLYQVPVKKQVSALLRLGKIPDDNAMSDTLFHQYDKILQDIETPLTWEEAESFITLFSNDCDDLNWGLLHLIETVFNHDIHEIEKYQALIAKCNHDEFKKLFQIRLQNWMTKSKSD